MKGNYFVNNKEKSNISIATEVSLESAQLLANKRFGGKSIPIGQFEITPNDILISGQEDHITVNSNLSGSFDGTAIIKAKPYYNATNKKIDFENIDLELIGNGLKSKSIALLASSVILEKIREKLSIPVDFIFNKINEQIIQFNIQDGVVLNAMISEYDIQEISIQKNKLNVLLNLKGNIAIQIEEIKF